MVLCHSDSNFSSEPIKVQIIRIHQFKMNMKEKCALDFMKVLRQERERRQLRKEKGRSMLPNLLSQPILSAGSSCDRLTYIGGVLWSAIKFHMLYMSFQLHIIIFLKLCLLSCLCSICRLALLKNI